MNREELRLKIAEANDSICKGYYLLKEIDEQLSVEEINGKYGNIPLFKKAEITAIKNKSIDFLKKKGDSTFTVLFEYIKKKVSPEITLTYAKLKYTLKKYPVFKRGFAKRAKKMGRTPLIYSYVGKDNDK
jgi:hypothetical protein